MRVVRLDGQMWSGAGAPARGARDAHVGPGLIETMRAAGGRIAFRDLHMARLGASLAACGFSDAVAPEVIAAALDEVIGAAGTGDLLVRLVVGRDGALLVETDDLLPLDTQPPQATAIVQAGLWDPRDTAAGHKLTGRDRWVAAEAAARAAGADVVLAADDAGRLGEASRAAVFVVARGELWTAPLEGILPSVGREVILGLCDRVRMDAPGPEVWRHADEVFVVSALRGVTAIVAIDGTPVGAGLPGPVTTRLCAAFAAQANAR